MVGKNFLNSSQKVFKLFGFWSFRQENNKTLLARFLKWMIVTFTCFILFIINLSETIEEMRQGVIAFTFVKTQFVAVIVCSHKVCSAAFYDDKIYACIKQLERLSNGFKNTSDIEKYLRLYNKLFVLGFTIMNTSCFMFLIAPLTTGEYRSLPYKPHLPYLNVKNTPNWQLLYFYEFVALLILTSATIAYDTLFCGLMCICTGILSSIGREIREFDDIIGDHKTLNTKMKDTIKKISEITQLIKQISDTFSMTTMTHVIYNVNTIALGLFMITALPYNINFIVMVMVVVLELFQLWIYCYFGQIIVSQREVLRRDLYFIRWYDTTKDFKTMLLLTIFESQCDRYVYAGKLIPLSFETFAVVLKKAYVFFTFLNNSR